MPAYLVSEQIVLESIPLGCPFKGSAMACHDKHFISKPIISASRKIGSTRAGSFNTCPKRKLSK